MELVYERWQSTDAQSAVHYFIKGTDTYIFGYNPEFISSDQVIQMLNELGVTETTMRKRRS